MQDQTTFHSSLAKNAGCLPITLKDIMDIVSEEDILAYYFHIYKLPTITNSPFRKDTHPSFSVYVNNRGRIYGYDFGTKRSYGIFDMMMALYHTDFKSILQRIWKDMCYITTQVKTEPRKRVHISTNKVKLEVRTRPFKTYDLEYWNQFGINQQWLRFGRIFAISDIIRKCENTIMNLPADKYAYVYVEFKDNIQSLKIYQPFNTRYKWMSDGNQSIWSLWSQLPETGDKLIITSSVKDALCLWANIHIPSCSLQSETTIPKPHVVEQLKQRFKHIYVLYDNDFNKQENVGQQNAQKLVNKYNFINVCIDDDLQVKDPSDFYKKYGYKQFYKYFYGKFDN